MTTSSRDARKHVDPISQRKADHIRINLEEDVRSRTVTHFDDLHFEYQALPELDLDQVDTGQTLFGKYLKHPFLISSMTGGTDRAHELNQRLASAAQKYGFAMGLGSQRAALENPDLVFSFKVRNVAPDILLFANLGAVQLNYGYTIDHCRLAVDMIEADALILHLNALQEALQPEGNTRFGDLLPKIEQICRHLPVPVIAKEVGWGISGTSAARLIDAGISAIDASGAGGTSWARVEMHRAQTATDADIAALFADWGIPTVEAIRQIRQVSADIPLFASGGIRSGIDAAKALALGANLAGLAGPFLKAADQGEHVLVTFCEKLINELRISMFATSAKDLQTLQTIPLFQW